MKRIFQSKSLLQKIAIIVLVVLLCYCIIPTYTYASWGGEILKVFVQLLAALGDVVTGALNHFMLGTDAMINSIMLDQNDPTVTTGPTDGNPPGALYAAPGATVDLTLNQQEDDAGNTGDDNEEKLDGGLWGDEDDWQIPNILYSPEAIFSNRIAALDVNFLSPNRYSSVQEGSTSADEASQSSAQFLQSTIANWYVGFRNIAVVALLVVLVYIGIKIMLGSISEKAKYKEGLRDWLLALCLVFIIHFIMSGILMVTQKVTELFSQESSNIVVEVVDGSNSVRFTESLIGVARLRVQSANAGTAATFCLIYMVLVVYTVMFTFTYLKRFLYMAFLTMIAPLVAITYPIDRMGDGQAQAFNMWFKEYLMNAILQPIHLILYTALISSAHDLVVKNWIYAIVAIAFLIPAEKFIKKMFGFDKAETPGTLGGFAAGALTMKAMSGLSNFKGIGGGSNNKGGQDKVRTADNANSGYLSENPRYNGLKDSPDSNSAIIGTSGGGTPQGPQTGDGRGIQTPGGSGALNGNNSGGTVLLGGNGQNAGLGNGAGSVYGDNNYNGTGIVTGGVNPNDTGVAGGNISTRGIGAMGAGYGMPSTSSNDFQLREGVMARAGDFARGKARDAVGALERTRLGGKAVDAGRSFASTKPGRALGATGKVAIKGAKTLAKTAWKNKRAIARTVAGAGMAAMGAGIGLAAGLATGDPSNVWQFAGAGLISGNAIGRNAANMTADAISGVSSGVTSSAGSLRNNFEEEYYGLGEAETRRQQRAEQENFRKFMKDDDQLKQAKKMQAQLAQDGQKVDVKDIMRSRYDYVSAGIDDKQIENAQKAEARSGVNGSTHEQYVRIAAQAKKYGIDRTTFNDEKKYDGVRKTLATKMGSEEQGNAAMGIMAEIYGEKAGHETQMNRVRAEKAKAEAEAAQARAREQANNRNGRGVILPGDSNYSMPGNNQSNPQNR